MKGAVITVRLPRATRKRIEALARRGGRSLSQQVERLIERAMARLEGSGKTLPETDAATRQRVRPLAGILRGGRAPTLADFREVRSMLSVPLGRRSRGHPDR